MCVRDVLEYCLNITKDTDIKITDSCNEEICYAHCKDIPPYLLTEEIRYFNIRLFRGVDNDEYLIEITLENAIDDMF